MFEIFLGILFQLTLFSLAGAAPLSEPISAQSHGNAWQYGAGGGLLGFIVLVLDVIIFIEVLKSNRTVPAKVLWCAFVFIFPIVGMVIYWLFSNRAEHNTTSGYEAI